MGNQSPRHDWTGQHKDSRGLLTVPQLECHHPSIIQRQTV